MKFLKTIKNNSGDGSLLEQLEALRSTLWKCVAAVALLLIPAFYFSPALLHWMIAYSCPEGLDLHYFSPLEPLMVQLNLGLFLAVIAASPVIFWQFGMFISPGLYAHERRAVLFFSLFALLLAVSGIALGFFFVIPQIMQFSLSFAAEGLRPVVGLGSFLKMMIWMLAGFALVFEIPVLLLLPVRAGLLKVQTIRKARPVAVIVIFVVAALLTPPDVVSQLALGIPGMLLFEATILIAGAIAPAEVPEAGCEMPGSSCETELPPAGETAGKRGNERARLRRSGRKIRKM